MPDIAWTTTYRQIHRPNVRSIARHAALSAAALANGGGIARDLARPRVHFVYLHHVFADEVRAFDTLVGTLLKHMTPLSYDDAVAKCSTGSTEVAIDKPYVCFSFDDGFKNNLAAADVLDAHGVKACFFVCPGLVGESNEQKLIHIAREKFHLPPIQFMDWNDLESLRSRGHAIGNHTMWHDNLATSGESLPEQIEHSLALLKLRFGDVKHFAWPYGHFRAITGFVRDSIFSVGHTSCASAVRGAHVMPSRDARSLCIRRDHLIAAWPVRHALYLLARSARQASARDNDWPTDLI